MSDFDRHSRVNKFEKRRKNTKTISVLLISGSILLIIFFGVLIFGGDDKESDTLQDQSSEDQTKVEDDDKINGEDDTTEEGQEVNTSDEETEKGNNTEQQNEVETKQIEPTEENVLEAYTGNWQPIGTEQTEPHTIQFKKDTQEWAEMEQAIRLATGLEENNMITYWLGNGGDQQAIGTVSNNDKSKIYRVTIRWIEHEGWQPLKVEVLKEVDV